MHKHTCAHIHKPSSTPAPLTHIHTPRYTPSLMALPFCRALFSSVQLSMRYDRLRSRICRYFEHLGGFRYRLHNTGSALSLLACTYQLLLLVKESTLWHSYSQHYAETEKLLWHALKCRIL